MPEEPNTPPPADDAPPPPPPPPVGDPPPDPPPAGDPPPAAAGKPWYQRRIDELTAARREAERKGQESASQLAVRDTEITALREQLAKAQTPPPAGTPPAPPIVKPGLTEADVERRAQALAGPLAQQAAAQAEFDRKANIVADAGKAEFPDWDARMTQVGSLFDRDNPQSVGQFNVFIDSVIEAAGEAGAHKILHALGGDPDEVMRISRLAPVKMAVEIAKIATGAKPLSKAPAPMRVLNGRSTSTAPIDPADPDRSDKLSTKDWMERRTKQVRGVA